MFEQPSDPTPCAYGRCLPLTAFLAGVGSSRTFNAASVRGKPKRSTAASASLSFWTAARVRDCRRPSGGEDRATRQLSPLLLLFPFRDFFVAPDQPTIHYCDRYSIATVRITRVTSDTSVQVSLHPSVIGNFVFRV